MAELNTSENKRAVPKVDLTAMVDLAFLLITFFMLTTSLSKPVAMDIAKPSEDGEVRMDLPASRTMTILLAGNNRVAWYMGAAENIQPRIENYHQIRTSILKNKEMIAQANAGYAKKGLIVIIKPTAKANYKNLVDIMDELSVAKIAAAPAIDDDHFSVDELAFLANNKF